MLQLSNGQGAVTLRFERADPSTPTGGTFRYEVVAGTGPYRGASGSGTFRLQLGGPILAIWSGTRSDAPPVPDGSFTLSFSAAAPRRALPRV